MAERLKKKDAPGRLYKSSSENHPFFNKNQLFTVKADENTYFLLAIQKRRGKYNKKNYLSGKNFSLNGVNLPKKIFELKKF